MSPALRAARAALAALLATLGTCAALAAEPVAMELLTWTELRDRIAAGATTALVPIGGTEQNGPHMVLGKHNVRVRVLAERIAARHGKALVAPVVAYVPEGSIDPPTGHMRWPGTITVDEAAFESTLASIGRSLRAHGFRTVVFVGDHGGYQSSLARVADRLTRAWAGQRPAARAVALVEYYRASTSGYGQWLAEQGHGAREIGSHAGLADTALAMAVEPSLVRDAALREPSSRGSGVDGDPAQASAGLGQLGVERIVESSVVALRAIGQAAPARPKEKRR